MNTDDIRRQFDGYLGKPVMLSKHAAHAMDNERPPVTDEQVVRTLAAPDLLQAAGRRRAAWRRFGPRYVIVRYVETEDEYDVRTVSCARQRPPL